MTKASRSITRNRKKAPIAAVVTIGLVLAFESGVIWKHRYHFWDVNYILLEKKYDAMTAPEPADDIAIFGSSRFYHVDPERLSQELGGELRIRNYSWGFCGAETYEAMLRVLINAGRIPKLIVLDGIPEAIGYDSHLMTITKNEGFLHGFTQASGARASLRTTIGQKEWRSTWNLIAYYMKPPSSRYGEPVNAFLSHTIQNRELPPLPQDYDRMVDHWQETGYFLFPPPDRVATMPDYEAFEKSTGPYKLRNNKTVRRKFERFIRLAEENDIRVVMLPVPNNELVFEKFTQTGVYDSYDQWMSKLEEKHPNFSAPHPRWINWPGKLGDAIHVNAAGADQHNQFVADILAQIQAK